MPTRKFLVCAVLLILILPACSGSGNGLEEVSTAAPEPQVVIDRVSVEVMEGELKPAIQAAIFGHYTDSCTQFRKEEGAITQVFIDGVFYISVRMIHMEGADCSLPGGEFQLGIGVRYDELTAGEYFVDVHGIREPFVLDRDVIVDADLVDQVVARVRSNIQDSFGVWPMDIFNMEQVTWGDSCLEIQLADRDCLEVETPGYRITAGTGDQLWQYRSNADGSLLLLEPDEGVSLQVSVLSDVENANLRAGPGQNYPVVGQLAANDSVTVVGVSHDGVWLQIGPYPYILAWLLASQTDYSPNGVQLPVIDLATQEALSD